MDALRVPSCVAALQEGEPTMIDTAVACAGAHVECVTVPRCLLVWAVAHSVLCLPERGERGTLLAMVQRLCLGLSEAASPIAAKKTKAFQTYLGC